ncbi:Zinc transport protein ZntB [Candidatus Lokiarchaeum ossiferum]|uniref:Magnesium transport protein CorA n=1 Tax=Candidatus Lokiarchaeum ossiferum TaxID=2951803 RepID=A0ABY6HLB0_9ARCH|nr:Zinc transport protein ZntB [Candidatus Lokiarchaeum sp. B-35]
MIKRNKKGKKQGLPPGTLVYSGEKAAFETQAYIIEFNEQNFETREITTEKCDVAPHFEQSVRWIRIIGLKNIDLISQVLNLFEIHPLVMEDIFATSQRSKYEDYRTYIYTVLKNIYWDAPSNEITYDQVSLILGKNYVLSFEEREGNLFLPILERISLPKGKVRSSLADYLFYCLIDITIDTYFSIIDIIESSIESLEDPVIDDPKPVLLQSIYRLKRDVNDFRKSIWPLREVINKIQREASPLFSSGLEIYFRDIYDHIFRLSDLIDNQRDIIFGMFDLYLSSVSNKMNDIMKVLTIISTIFIPLSFMSGFYGMNFKYMPELDWKPSYPILIGVMVIVVGLMIYYFKRKNFFSK